MKEDRTVVAAGDARNDAEKLGITHGMIVQELGWDEDTDDDLRALLEQQCGSDLVDEDTDEVIDVAVLWWRDGDGDLVDALMDAIGSLADDGMVWVLSPKTGVSGHVEPSEIAEAAPTAGLTQTLTMNLGDWAANRLVQPKVKGKR